VNYLQLHEHRKDEVLSVLKETSRYFSDVNEEETAKNLQDQYDSLQENEFSIVVVGEFSAGKSTFLNALMGEKYLTSFTSETTATINFLQHTSAMENEHSLKVVYKDPTRSPEYAEATSEDIRRFVSTDSDKKVATEIDHVTLYLDSPFLEQGVRLVDSPGLNGAAEGHAEVTENQVEKSHACIYMFSATRPGSRTDFDVLASLNEKFNTIFLVLNQIDRVNPNEESVEEIINKLQMNYARQFPNHSLPKFYPISAYQALAARNKESLEWPSNSGLYVKSDEQREELLEKSRVLQFEDRLTHFLAHGEKTQEGLLTPIKQAATLIDQRQQYIGQLLVRLVDIDGLTQLEDNVEQIEQELERVHTELREQKVKIEHDLDDIIDSTGDTIDAEAEKVLFKLTRHVNAISDPADLEYYMTNVQMRVQSEFVKIVAKIDRNFRSDFQRQLRHTYESVAINLREEKDTVEIDVPDFNFESIGGIQIDLNKYEAEMEHYETQIRQMNDEIEQGIQQQFIANQKRRQIEQLQHNQERLQQRLELERLMYGERPDVHILTEETREQRGGIFGAIASILVGKKRDTRQSEDDTERKSYDNRIKELLTKHQNKDDLIEDQLQEERSALIRAESKVELTRLNEERLARIKLERDEAYEKNRLQFQEQSERKLRLLKREFEDGVEDLRDEMRDSFEVYLLKQKQTLVELVQVKVEDHFKKTLESKEQELEKVRAILESSESERAAKKEQAVNESETLEKLQQRVFDVKKDIESIVVDQIELEAIGGM